MAVQRSGSEAKSGKSLAFDHYLRAGERLAEIECKNRNERKFDLGHAPENGRFTFASGGAQARSGHDRRDAIGPKDAGSVRNAQMRTTAAKASNSEVVRRAPRPLTVEHLRAIMPCAGGRAKDYAEALNIAMAHHGISTPEQRAAFLAQISVESGDLQRTSENLNYSAKRLTEVWPRRFPTIAAAQPYANNPVALANHVYANRLGNGDERSGDGYRYRGRGLMQVTGRTNYRKLGFEGDPDALAAPQNAAFTAAAFWRDHDLQALSRSRLNRQNFDAISRIVNGGNEGLERRWVAYQRALAALEARGAGR